MYKEIELDEITDRVQVRSTNLVGIEWIKNKIEAVGYNPEKPLLVTTNTDIGKKGYILIDGNHRYEGLKKLNITRVPVYIDDTLVTSELRLRRARKANEVTSVIVPQTFVDDAELVWALKKDKYTGDQIGNILGDWKKSQISNYYNLCRIDDEVWKLISTTVSKIVESNAIGVVEQNSTTVNFTENLLRLIVPLIPDQQLELIQDLMEGKDKNPKEQFKKKAIAYKVRNAIKKYIIEQSSQISNEFIKQRLNDVDKGGYDIDWETEDKLKITQFIQAISDEWEQKSGTKLIFGDFGVEINGITDQSVDLILTDIPYNISNQGKLTKVGQDMVNAAFDAGDKWDTDTLESYYIQLQSWVSNWERVLKPGGSVISFCDKPVSGILWQMFSDVGLNSKNLIIWERTNPHPSGLIRKNLISSVEIMVWAIKPGQSYTFNSSDNWDRKNIIKASFCSGHERLKDEKGETLHKTQKPLAILTPLIEVFSNRGDLVFDGFMGVGSVGDAALSLGRKFIGIENVEKYFNAAQKRLGGV